MRLVSHWIDGKPWLGEPERTGVVTDPATGEQTAEVAFAGPAEVDGAVTAAARAFETWRNASVRRRTDILFSFRDLLRSRRDELATVIAGEHGKVLDDARGEVDRGIDVVEFACGVGHLLKGGSSENVSTDVDTYSLRQPLGVAVGITPFNFPAMVPLWMTPVALACGNSFVLKPSEKDPSASLLLARWLADSGLPDGVFNVVHGDGRTVEALLVHPSVSAVSFVGSTPVARHVYETATGAGKRVQALGGAKNHAVVLPDADVEATADALTSAAYGSAGERCMAVSAVVAVGDVGDPLVAALEERLRVLRVGAAADEEAQMGPLVTAGHRDRVRGHVDRGVEEGALLRVDGRGLVVEGHEQGFFLGPCLFDHVTPEMTIYRDEIFGPVLVVLRADSFEDALGLVNRNPYGNGVAIFTRDGGVAREFCRRIEVGMVGVNVPIPVPTAYYSFGGWKQSLFGDLHVHGPEGVQFYTRTKTVTARWPGTTSGEVDLRFPSGAA